MVTIMAMLVLIVVSGWLDSRLNWRQTGSRGQEARRG
jgi:hypothetical protein